MDLLHQKYETLNGSLREMGTAVIAFSGGVDSTFLVQAAFNQLGKDLLAVTATSSTYPVRELNEAKELAKKIGVTHKIISSEELDIPGFSENPNDRCYYCKGELFGKLKEIADENGFQYLLDGSNKDDLSDYRPGSKAASEVGVRSPLQEAEFTKEEIRLLSKELGLPTWDKPAFACLASRFPYGKTITQDKLSAVDKAEEILRGFGFYQVRVRHHDDIARIEVGSEEINRFFSDGLAEKISSSLKEIGFTYVTVDIDGYRTGSMNETIIT